MIQSIPLPTTKVTNEKLSRMEGKIFLKRPQLKTIKETYGDLSYFAYSKRKNRLNPNKNLRVRKAEAVTVIKHEVQRLLGSAIANSVEKQLKDNDSISTAEHTAPLSTPDMLNAALHTALPMFGNVNPQLQNIIILSCSGVSFSNTLSFSRGFLFHLFSKGVLSEQQLTFFGRATDAKTVLYAPAYTPDAIGDMKKRLINLRQEGALGQAHQEKLDSLLDTIYTAPHPLTASEYVDQLTITNYSFWKDMFSSFKGHVPNYVMLSQEKIVLQLLLHYHLYHDTIIHRFLFSPRFYPLIEKYFDGITGAFTQEQGYGTFLFWGVSKKDNQRFQLFRDGNQLVSKDRTYSVPLTPDAIGKAIEAKELIPSLLLTFILLSFYYGLLLGGGASQPTYLTDMKKAYIAMLQELGETEAIEDCRETPTDDFVFFRPHLAFLQASGESIDATGLDMYLYANPSAWKSIIESTKSISLTDFITLILPVLYKQFCPDDEKEDDLMQITRMDMQKYLGLDTKLPPIASLE